MTLGGVKRLLISACLVCLVLACTAVASSKKKQPPKQPAKTIDSGSFGIFVNGRRVATETFKIEQQAQANVITSEIKLEDGSSHQKSEMQLTSNGTLLKYEWNEISPMPLKAEVVPSDQFLVQRYLAADPKDTKSMTHLLPASTMILDDNFFAHRQLLAWRYLGAAGCGGGVTCKLEKADFGVLVPHQQTSVTVTVEFVGKDKANIKGAEQELSRFSLRTDDQNWTFWLDEQHRLVRIQIAAANTEVVRD